MKKITTKKLGKTLTALAKSFDEELFSKKETELESEYWHFKFDKSSSLNSNLYQFTQMLDLYRSFCRRWEEKHGGVCCVVERVRDKYLMPKIRQFVVDFIKSIKTVDSIECIKSTFSEDVGGNKICLKQDHVDSSSTVLIFPIISDIKTRANQIKSAAFDRHEWEMNHTITEGDVTCMLRAISEIQFEKDCSVPDKGNSLAGEKCKGVKK